MSPRQQASGPAVSKITDFVPSTDPAALGSPLDWIIAQMGTEMVCFQAVALFYFEIQSLFAFVSLMSSGRRSNSANQIQGDNAEDRGPFFGRTSGLP